MQSREERAGLDIERFVSDLGYSARYAHAVQGLERERFQYQQIERSLNEVGLR